MTNSILSGLRILDMSEYIAGPYCAKMLAEMGAEVIKVERPGSGDGARRMGPFFQDKPHPEGSGLWGYLNTGKKGITLNLDTVTGRRLFLELVKVSDVAVESFAPGVMETCGLGFEVLEQVNPGLVMTSVTSFGQTGPYNRFKAAEIICFAMGGLMSLLGDPDQPPTKLYEGIVQYWTGGQAFAGTMAAILKREITGEGQQVDVSLLETLAYHANASYLQYLYKGEVTKRNGNRTMAFGGAPTIYRVMDGYVQAMLRPFEAVVELLEAPALLKDPRFSPDTIRQHGAVLGDIIAESVKDRHKEELFRAAQEKRLPWATMNSPADIIDSHHLKEEGFFKPIDHPVTGCLSYPGSPLKMGDTEMVYRRSPLLGEHNAEVYCGLLDYQREDLTRLRENNVI